MRDAETLEALLVGCFRDIIRAKRRKRVLTACAIAVIGAVILLDLVGAI